MSIFFGFFSNSVPYSALCASLAPACATLAEAAAAHLDRLSALLASSDDGGCGTGPAVGAADTTTRRHLAALREVAAAVSLPVMSADDSKVEQRRRTVWAELVGALEAGAGGARDLLAGVADAEQQLAERVTGPRLGAGDVGRGEVAEQV